MKIGVLSTARINYMGIIRPLSLINDAKISAIASHSKNEDIQAYAKIHNIKKVYTSYHDLLNDSTINAVYISLPNSYHFDYAKDAIKAKKNVLCEKPITLFYEELIKLEELANTNNVFLMEALHYHYFPPIISLIKNIQENFEDITDVEAFLGFPEPKDGDIRLNPFLGGGVFNHLGCYLTHFITWLFPDKEWTVKNFNQTFNNAIDIKASGKIASHDLSPINYSFNVSFDHPNIDSWVKFKSKKHEMFISHAFTPTTFYNPMMPDKLVLSVSTDHPAFKDINYLKNNDKKTTYDYQLEYFLKKINMPLIKQEINKEAHLLKSRLLSFKEI